MIRVLTILMTLCMSMAVVQPAQARQEGIVAVVNEDAISGSDLNDRLRMVIASSGLPDTPQVRQELTQQVLGSLIEEQIKLQEARRLGIEVTTEDIDRGFATIAQQNNIPPEKFSDVLEQGGINADTIRRQIESQVAWSKVIQTKLRPQVVVSDNDIDGVLGRLASNKGLSEYLVAEVFLPVEDSSNEQDTRQLAQKLSSEIKAGKVPFYKVAQQFSKAAGAAQGGDIGWVQHSQLPEELARTLESMSKDQVSAPVRSLSGYHILYLRDQRQISDETMPSREEVMSNIGIERLERLQRRYLLDLKAEAFIENRLGS